jgi:hypothetical protein
MRLAASPEEMAAEQLDSNEEEEEACGARIRMRRRSASEEMLTRVAEGWGEEDVSSVMLLFGT